MLQEVSQKDQCRWIDSCSFVTATKKWNFKIHEDSYPMYTTFVWALLYYWEWSPYHVSHHIRWPSAEPAQMPYRILEIKHVKSDLNTSNTKKMSQNMIIICITLNVASIMWWLFCPLSIRICSVIPLVFTRLWKKCSTSCTS